MDKFLIGIFYLLLFSLFMILGEGKDIKGLLLTSLFRTFEGNGLCYGPQPCVSIYFVEFHHPWVSPSVRVNKIDVNKTR